MIITKGDTRTFHVTVYNNDGSLMDLSSYTMKFTAKDPMDITDAEADISSTAVIASPETGVGVFTLTPTDTGIDIKTYVYDVQISDGADHVYTIIKNSILEIVEQITREI